MIFFEWTQKGDEGEYREMTRSAAFPFLHPSDIFEILELRTTLDENSVIRKFLERARERYAESERA